MKKKFSQLDRVEVLKKKFRDILVESGHPYVISLQYDRPILQFASGDYSLYMEAVTMTPQNSSDIPTVEFSAKHNVNDMKLMRHDVSFRAILKAVTLEEFTTHNFKVKCVKIQNEFDNLVKLFTILQERFSNNVYTVEAKRDEISVAKNPPAGTMGAVFNLTLHISNGVPTAFSFMKQRGLELSEVLALCNATELVQSMRDV